MQEHDRTHLRPERILLPIDTSRCPLEVFELVNGFAKCPKVSVILLHVVHVNIVAPENRVFDELCDDAHWQLEQLARKFLHPIASPLIRVRLGRPADQIVAEAKAERADLIILPTYGPSFWNRLAAIWKPSGAQFVSRMTQRVIREATCGVFVVMAKTRFDCEQAWGRRTVAQAQTPRKHVVETEGSVWSPAARPAQTAL